MFINLIINILHTKYTTINMLYTVNKFFRFIHVKFMPDKKVSIYIFTTVSKFLLNLFSMRLFLSAFDQHPLKNLISNASRSPEQF